MKLVEFENRTTRHRRLWVFKVRNVLIYIYPLSTKKRPRFRRVSKGFVIRVPFASVWIGWGVGFA